MDRQLSKQTALANSRSFLSLDREAAPYHCSPRPERASYVHLTSKDYGFSPTAPHCRYNLAGGSRLARFVPIDPDPDIALLRNHFAYTAIALSIKIWVGW